MILPAANRARHLAFFNLSENIIRIAQDLALLCNDSDLVRPT
jgi:hypothetical protein